MSLFATIPRETTIPCQSLVFYGEIAVKVDLVPSHCILAVYDISPGKLCGPGRLALSNRRKPSTKQIPSGDSTQSSRSWKRIKWVSVTAVLLKEDV